MSVTSQTRALLSALVQGRAEPGKNPIADLAAQIQDWNEVLKLAAEHRIFPLLRSHIQALERFIPSEALDVMQSELDRNTFHCLANAAELIAILAIFDKLSIPLMPFKGVTLAASVYPEFTDRSPGDLDFLVFSKDLRRASEALKSRGFELKTPAREDGSPAVENYYEFHFERPSDGMVVELRWRLELTQSRFRRDLGMEWIWPRRREAEVAGKCVPDMNAVDKMLVLCMHGSKHQWSRLIWIYDVARLIAVNTDLDWKEVTQEAKRRGLWRSLALGVVLAHRVCGADVPGPVLDQFSSDRAANSLATAFADSLFEEPGRTPTSRIPYGLRILDFSDRVRWLLRMEFLRPNDRDLSVIQLPTILRPLYLLIRPVRLLLDRSAR